MKRWLIALALVAPSVAHADGLPILKCKRGGGGCCYCDASGADAASIATALGLVGLVAFTIRRRRR